MRALIMRIKIEKEREKTKRNLPATGTGTSIATLFATSFSPTHPLEDHHKLSHPNFSPSSLV